MPSPEEIRQRIVSGTSTNRYRAALIPVRRSDPARLTDRFECVEAGAERPPHAYCLSLRWSTFAGRRERAAANRVPEGDHLPIAQNAGVAHRSRADSSFGGGSEANDVAAGRARDRYRLAIEAAVLKRRFESALDLAAGLVRDLHQ